jgi:nitrogen fixation NifU-like protein
MVDYNPKVLDFFKKSKNLGPLKNPDAVGEVGNLMCGDVMKAYLKVKKRGQKEYISDLKFETYGCLAALASSLALMKLAKGKTLENALKITAQDIIKTLGGLPAFKIHCSVLAHEALAEAIYSYYQKQKREIPEELEKRHQLILKTQEILKNKFKEFS